MEDPEWKTFEKEVHAELASLYPDASIRYDAALPGALSGTERQIDVLVEERLPTGIVRTAVDSKHRARPVDVKEVESFIGLLHDTGVNRGVIVSSSGYTEAALTRAYRDDVDLDLDVATLDEFKQWQAPLGIPYAGENAVIMPAPFAWAVDGQRRPGLFAMLYRRGLTLEVAARNREFMYINLWERCPPADSLEALLESQARDIREHSPDALLSVREFRVKRGSRACIRRADIPRYPAAEITGFVEFTRFIFFAVMFTPLVVERRNTRKLEYLLQRVIPASVRKSAV